MFDILRCRARRKTAKNQFSVDRCILAFWHKWFGQRHTYRRRIK